MYSFKRFRKVNREGAEVTALCVPPDPLAGFEKGNREGAIDRAGGKGNGRAIKGRRGGE